MTKNNNSATHFLITYLIYLFVKNKNIIRTETNSYGDLIKYGSLKPNNNVKLIGHSGTQSGDGNTISIKYKKIQIKCPTEQFIDCSINIEDYNRFWIE